MKHFTMYRTLPAALLLAAAAAGADGNAAIVGRADPFAPYVTFVDWAFPGYYPFPAGSTDNLRYLPLEFIYENEDASHTTRMSYDEHNRLTMQVLDAVASGSAAGYNATLAYDYDDAGRVVRIVNSFDGTPENNIRFAYDEENPRILVSILTYRGADDTELIYGYNTNITRNAAGNVTEVLFSSFSSDSDIEGWHPWRRCLSAYAADGSTLLSVTEQEPAGAGNWSDMMSLTDISVSEPGTPYEIFSISGLIIDRPDIRGVLHKGETTVEFESVVYDTPGNVCAVSGTIDKKGVKSEFTYRLDAPVENHADRPSDVGFGYDERLTVTDLATSATTVSFEGRTYDAYGNMLSLIDGSVDAEGYGRLSDMLESTVETDADGLPVSVRCDDVKGETPETLWTRRYIAWTKVDGITAPAAEIRPGRTMYFLPDGTPIAAPPVRGLYIYRDADGGGVRLAR